MKLVKERGSDIAGTLALDHAREAMAPAIAPMRTVARPARGFAAILHTCLEAAEGAGRALEADGSLTAFQSFDWIRAIRDHLIDPGASDWQIVEVVCRRTGETLLILPLVRTRRRGFRVTDFVSAQVCDYAAPILARGLGLDEADMAEIWSAARSALAPTDIIRVSLIAQSPYSGPNPLATMAGATLSPHVAMSMPLKGDDSNALDQCFPAQFVRDYHKFSRKIGRKGGPFEFVEARTVAEANEILDTLVKQRTARFARIGRADLLMRPEVVAFYRAAALRGIEDGSARLVAARVRDETIATCFALVHARVLYVPMLAIDDDKWRDCAPGKLLYGQIVRWAVRNNLTYFDLGIGMPDFKASMGFASSPLYNVVEAVTLKGAAIVRLQGLGAAGHEWLRERPAIYERLRRARQFLRRSSLRRR